MKLSEILSQKIVCMSEARELGVILSATVDVKMRRIKQFITADRDEEDGYIAVNAVHFGKDVAFTISKGLTYEKQGITVPLRREIYDTDGAKIGILTDVEFENGKIEKLYVDGGVSGITVVNASAFMVVAQGSRKIRAKKPTESKADLNAFDLPDDIDVSEAKLDFAVLSEADSEKTSVSVPPAPAQADEIKAVDKQDSAEEVKESEGLTVSEEKETAETSKPDTSSGEKALPPDKIVYGYEFLLGRKVTKSVLKNGAVVIEKGTVIDASVVEKAGATGKLVELTVNSI